MTAPDRLTGRVALVTGAARGLGRAMAVGLGSAGADLVLVDADASALTIARDEIARDCGSDRAIAVPCDIREARSCENAVAAALQAFGSLSILVNNAGRGPTIVEQSVQTRSLRFWEADPERWGEVITTNVVGTFLMSRASAVPMIAQGWGRIINISTSRSTMLRAQGSPYGVSKVAIEAETLIWAQDLAGTGVTVNSLAPGGAADTDFVSAKTRLAAQAGSVELLSPEIMVAPIRWLASPESDGVTGARFVAKLWEDALAVSEAAARAREPSLLG